MDSVILQLPREGQLVTIPLLNAAAQHRALLNIAVTGTGATTSVTMSSAAITYADLRILGFIGWHMATGTAAGLGYTWEINTANVNGDIQLLYGPAFGQTLNSTTTTFYGRLLVPSLRDNSLIEKNTRVRAVLTSRHSGGSKIKAAICAQMAAICERVSDPKAARY